MRRYRQSAGNSGPAGATGLLLAAAFVAMAFAAAPAAAATYTQLYEFQGGDDGSGPRGALAFGFGGVVYGATSSVVGSSGCKGGCGTVYSLTPPRKPGGTWREAVLYRFAGGDDGSRPSGVTLGDDGALYGFTNEGGGTGCGGSGCGTAFRLTPPTRPSGKWNERVLYSFAGGSDAAAPVAAPLLASNGTLFGASSEGGGGDCSSGCGAIFQLSPPAYPADPWTENVLHAFSTAEGGPPVHTPTFFRGSLYGALRSGGPKGCGTVYRLAPPAGAAKVWSESTLYAFDCGNDGGYPRGAVIVRAGVVYGVAFMYGARGGGTVFQLASPSKPGGFWQEETLHAFAETGDRGSFPEAVIGGAHGVLFGYTLGGFPGLCVESGCGIVLQLNPPAAAAGRWTETVPHGFDSFLNGLALGADGVLYGTGIPVDIYYGYGLVYSLVP